MLSAESTSPYVIETSDLSRSFSTYKKKEGLWNSIQGLWNRETLQRVALQPTNLKIEPGQIVGLVGANGAGKTTLLKLLAGLISPTTGSARVLGYNPHDRDAAFLKQISLLLGQKNQLWWDITPLDSYALLTEIYDLDPEKAKKKVQELATLLHCRHVLETQLRRLSLGERMKMEIIGALLHSPKILFLDEPTIGLDIVAQETIREFLAAYVKNKGPTVILTSHYMDDIARLADRLLLISKGQIVYDGTVEGFVDRADEIQTVTYKIHGENENKVEIKKSQLSTFLKELTQKGQLESIKIEETDFEDVIHNFLQKESRLF
ncbi:MAG: ATP-binding cassette domain-containing protein [Bdellovibrionales bacterium]